MTKRKQRSINNTGMGIGIIIVMALCVLLNHLPKTEKAMLRPITEVINIEVMAQEPEEVITTLEGMASWYGASKEACLGCSSNFTMANGQRLDDTKKTLACGVGGSCKQFPLGSKVRITNLKNMMTTIAWVTDTGGFAKYNRIADLSIATRDSLNAKGNCKVRIELIK